MERTKEKDALALAHKQLEEIREKIFALLHTRGVDTDDVHTITSLIRRTYLQLRANPTKAKPVTKNGTLNF